MARKVDKTGRSKSGGKFVALPEFMLASAAWQDTLPIARCVLIEIVRIYNGKNNGSLAMSATMAAERLRSTKATTGRALVELEAHGFIEKTAEGRFTPYSPRATEWRFTWKRCDRTGELPSKAFLRWQKRS